MVPRYTVRAAAVALASVTAFAIASAANTTSFAEPWCGTDSLSLSTGELTTTEWVGQDQLELILTNISQQPCTLQGYPGVDLVGADVPMLGPVFSVPRAA